LREGGGGGGGKKLGVRVFGALYVGPSRKQWGREEGKREREGRGRDN